MDYIYAAIAIIVLVAIYLVVRKNSDNKRNCGKIACEPIVPVADRDETGVAEHGDKGQADPGQVVAAAGEVDFEFHHHGKTEQGGADQQNT